MITHRLVSLQVLFLSSFLIRVRASERVLILSMHLQFTRFFPEKLLSLFLSRSRLNHLIMCFFLVRVSLLRLADLKQCGCSFD